MILRLYDSTYNDKHSVLKMTNKSSVYFTLQALRIIFSGSTIVPGPRPQFKPTTSAPASSKRLQASSTGIPSCIFSVMGSDKVTTDGKPGKFMLNKRFIIFVLASHIVLNHWNK